MGAEHARREESTYYALGVAWRHGFYLKYDYEAQLKVKLGIFPLGRSLHDSSSFGDDIWNVQSIDVAPALTKCERYCDHPFFDGKGTYHVRHKWREYHESRCYRPQVPLSGK